MDNNVNILDNRTPETALANKIKELIKETKTAKFATGYFYVDGYNLVKEDMQNIENLQIIMGDETTVATKEEISRGYDEQYKKAIVNNIKENILEDISKLSDEDQKRKIRDFHDLIAEDRADIKIFNKGKFHPKLYIFRGSNQTAIVGSSNFTRPGMEENVELNIIERQPPVIEELVRWFDDIWEHEAIPFKEDLISVIKSSGILEEEIIRWGTYLPPEELLKILAYELLDGRVDLTKERRILALFQEIGVLNAENKIKKFYGALIADSVGLGKSFIGTQIIKDLFYGKIDFWDDTLREKWKERGKAALLIVPAHLKKQWRDDVLMRNFFMNCIMNFIDGEFYFNLVDKTRGKEIGKIRIISYSKFTRLKEESLRRLADDFDIVLIDEVHRFKDENTNAWKNVHHLKKKVSYKIESGRGVEEGIRNRFVLLSATPLNNSISDLLNIFKIFLDRDLRDLSRQGKNVTLFDDYEKIKKELKNTPGNKELREKLKKVVKKIKNEILDDLMILRTRTYIRDSPLYKGTKINGKPLVFQDPTIKRILYDKKLKKYYDEYIDLYSDLADFLQKLEYPYIDLFLIEEKRKDSLRALMKILLLKRMESSVYSFDRSVRRIKEKEQFLLGLLESGVDLKKIKMEWQRRYGKREEDEIEEAEEVSLILSEEREEAEEEEKERFEIDVNALKEKATKDLELIEEYIKKIERVRIEPAVEKYKDPKLERLKIILNELIGNGGDIPKVLLFTQFKDTATYLLREINEWIQKQSSPAFRRVKTEIVTGEVDTETKERRMKRFAPIANEYEVKEGEEEINLLISTDALSEGVNLQDASIVIDYDLPWNPMRIVQRVGRVNRIGSEKQIAVYNFFPNKDLEELLKLLSKLWDKIEDVKNLLAKEMQILSEEEETAVDTIGEAIKNVRQETDISKLEINYRSEDFKIAEVYGEDVETIQKMRIISKLIELGIGEKEFEKLKKELDGIPYYTILENSRILRVYRIYDEVRKEKMRNFVVSLEGDEYKELGMDTILSLADVDEGKQIVELSEEEVIELKRRIIELDKTFAEGTFTEYKKLFTPLRQGQIQRFEGLHKKIVRHLRGLAGQRRIGESEEERNGLLRIKQIYESMKLRSNEVKQLKELFLRGEINLERDDLRKHSPEKIIEVLNDFYENYLSVAPDTYFGGIRTEKDLNYKVIGWCA